MDLNEKGFVAIKFGASWCAPCKMVSVSFDKMKNEFDSIEFTSVDVDEDPGLAKKFRIRSVPTVILVRDGQEVDRLLGSVKIEALRKSLRNLSKEKAA